MINQHKTRTIQGIQALCLFLLFAVSSCHPPAVEERPDPLPSWNDGPNKQAIIGFISTTTDSLSGSFIPLDARIAVFDNDGTLWTEQPLYFQFEFIKDRILQMAPEHPQWKHTQPFQAILENDPRELMAMGSEGLLKLNLAASTGMSEDAFKQTVRTWIDTARHPLSGKLYKEMVYQPMLELLQYFRANGFKTYIVSGGGVSFMRPWTEEMYGIPPEQVIGSTMKTSFEMKDGKPVIMRLQDMETYNDKEVKPLSINKVIGKRPVAAFGNSDGDLAMLQWTAAGPSTPLMVYIHHTDSVREWAYDRKSLVGRLDKGLDEANQNGWVVVDMMNDWKYVHPYELPQ